MDFSTNGSGQMDQAGVTYSRKARGKKLQFLFAGPTLEEARSYVNWEYISANGLVVEWHGMDGKIVILEKKG
jgi:hypothetical protein